MAISPGTSKLPCAHLPVSQVSGLRPSDISVQRKLPDVSTVENSEAHPAAEAAKAAAEERR